MYRYGKIVDSLLIELQGAPGPIKAPELPPTPTAGTITSPGGYVQTSPTVTTTGTPAKPPAALKPLGRPPTPKPGGGTIGAIITGLALGWDAYQYLRKEWEKKQQPIPMTMPPGYKEGDVVLPPLKPNEQGFAVPTPTAPPITPPTPPEQQPEQPKKPKVVPIPPVIPLRPETQPEPTPEPQPVEPPPSTPSTPGEKPSPESGVIPTPAATSEPVKPKEPGPGETGDTGRGSATGDQTDQGTGKPKIIPPPIPNIPDEDVIPGRGETFDFKAYPQGYNPDEPYGRWGPKSARRDTTQTSPTDLIKQTFTGQEPEVTSATPETETGPWAKRYKRYKDLYQQNPNAGQPTSFGNILKKSK